MHFLIRHGKLDRLVEGQPTVLIDRRVVIDDSLTKEALSRQTLEAAAHKQGFDNLGEVDRAVLESSGTISFIGKKPAPEETRHRELLGPDRSADTRSRDAAPANGSAGLLNRRSPARFTSSEGR